MKRLMASNQLRGLAACLLISGMVGCAGSSRNQRIDAQQTQMDNLRREVSFLQQQNSQYKRELESLKKQITEFELASRQDKADLRAKFDEVLQQAAAVQTQLQDTNARITRLTRGPLSPIDNRPASPDEAPTPDTSGRKVPSFAVDQSRELYNTAYRDFIRGNYQLSLSGFQEFVKQYRNSELIDNAQYWIGEVYYAQGRYPQAIQEFEKVLRLYSTGDKTISALLKIGYSYININETEQGRTYLNQVIKDYPDSDEAKLARGRLDALK